MITYDSFCDEWFSSSKYMIARTSGSTGTPKPIKLLKSDMIASAEATNRFFKIKKGDRLVCPLSLDYIAAKMMAVRAIIAEANLTLITPSNDISLDVRAKLLAIVPSQVDSLLFQPNLANNIDNIIIGGAPLSSERKNKLQDLGFNAFETYGMTETCSHVALKNIRDEYFTAIDNVTFEIDDRDCLVVNVPHMSIGKVVTNDVVKLHSDKKFTWLGRFDNVINSGGIKIHPEILESKISEILNDEYTFYITGLPHPKWGQEVVMVVETQSENIKIIEDKLSAIIDHKILPKKIIAVREIPRTSNGKIIRQI